MSLKQELINYLNPSALKINVKTVLANSNKEDIKIDKCILRQKP